VVPLIATASVAADEPKPAPSWAEVVVTVPAPIKAVLINHTSFDMDWDSVSGSIPEGIKRLNLGDGKLPKVVGDFNYLWFVMDPDPKKEPDRAGIQVGYLETDTDRLPKNFEWLETEKGEDGKARRGRRPLVMEGTLVQGFNGLGKYGLFAARCSKMRLVDDAGKAAAPPPGIVQVTGRAVSGKFKFAEGKEVGLAIENGDQPILIVGEPPKGFRNEGQRLRVVGKLQVGAGKEAQLWVAAESIKVVEKK
jgi:hypothetical protein